MPNVLLHDLLGYDENHPGPYYSSDPITQAKLEQDLYRGLKSLPYKAMALFMHAIDKRSKYELIHPKVLIDEIFIPSGFEYWEHEEHGGLSRLFSAIDTTTFDPAGFMSRVDPPIPWAKDDSMGTTSRVDWGDVNQAIRQATASNLQPNGIHPFSIFPKDIKYDLFPASFIPILIEAAIIRHKQYKTDSNDCDDFAVRFIAWLSEWGYGNCGRGWAEGVLYHNGQDTGEKHDIAIIVDQNFTVWAYDPQGDIRYLWKVGQDDIPIVNCDQIYWTWLVY